MSTRTIYGDRLVTFTFTVAHPCPKTIEVPGDVGTWTEFVLVEDDGSNDLFTFQCPRCKVRACVSMDVDTSKQARKARRR